MCKSQSKLIKEIKLRDMVTEVSLAKQALEKDPK